MKKIIGYFRQHLKSDFNLLLYLSVLFFLAISIFLNYQFNIENGKLNPHVGKPETYLYFFLLYAIPYYGTGLLILLVRKEAGFFREKGFWLKSLFFISLLAINGGTDIHYKWIFSTVPVEGRYFLIKVFLNLGSAIIFFIPILFFWFLIDRKKVNGIYGLAKKGFIPAPYFLLLLGMVPLIVLASYQADFLQAYPTYRYHGTSETYFNLTKWMAIGVYQFFYALDFVFVELIFRGALIIGLTGLMGKDCILPMVSTYCFLHFGKPMGEAVSSIFGGYILGVIAYYGKNIWGGAIVHIGIALMMEWAAMIQLNYLKN